jgi:type II secretory pathway pseudopilin PulG
VNFPIQIRNKGDFDFWRRFLPFPSNLLSLFHSAGMLKVACPQGLLNDNTQVLGRSPLQLFFRKRRSRVLENASNRWSTHAGRLSRNGSNRVNDYNNSIRSENVSQTQAIGQIPLSQLSEHDEAMDRGTPGKRIERIELHTKTDCKIHTSLCDFSIPTDSLSLKSRDSHKQNFSKSKLKAFSLIEIVAVLAIIMILIGLLIPISGYVQRMSVESRIKIEINGMEAALEAYKADYGAYPPIGFSAALNDIKDGDEKNRFLQNAPGSWPAASANYSTHKLDWGKSSAWIIHNEYLYAALGNASNAQGKVYYQFNPANLRPSPTLTPGRFIVVDPLGNPYGYYPSGSDILANRPAANASTFDLFSCGIDNKSSYPFLSNTNDDIGNWR